MAVRLNLYGPLRVVTETGEDLTPRSAKARGLLALLCTSEHFVRSRSWLKAHLWSDRADAQAAGSLRQTLTELRRSFGVHADCILAGRQDVQLCSTRVRLVQTETRCEFLEGLDIKDEQFEDWLRIERIRRADKTDAASNQFSKKRFDAPNLFVMDETKPEGGMEAFFSSYFADSVAKNIDEMTGIPVLREASKRPGHLDLTLRTSANFCSGLAGVRVSMERALSRQNLWSGAELIATTKGPPIGDEKLLRLVNQASEGICEALLSSTGASQTRIDVAMLERRAVRLIFGMKAEDQREADTLLVSAFELDPRGTHLSWRAMLRIIMLIEAHDGLPQDYADEAIWMAHKALEMEPLNSLVLAAAAHVAIILEHDNVRGLEFAERALRVNAANPFAIDAYSIAALYHGAIPQAHESQVRARFVAGNTQFAHWFDMGCCKTAAISGHFELAGAMAMRSVAGGPNFRPPLRYLIVLYLHSGQIEKAHATVAKLKAIEPGFEVDRLWHDDSYPVRDLRRSALVTKQTHAMLE